MIIIYWNVKFNKVFVPFGNCVASKVLRVSGVCNFVDEPAADISRYSTPVPVIALIFVLLCVDIPTEEEAPVILLQPSILIIGSESEVN